MKIEDKNYFCYDPDEMDQIRKKYSETGEPTRSIPMVAIFDGDGEDFAYVRFTFADEFCEILNATGEG